VREARVRGGVARDEQDGGVRARRLRRGIGIRVRNDTAANRYDRQDPRFRAASDELTTGKSEHRSNRRNSSAPG
jgi:hypothetical protein